VIRPQGYEVVLDPTSNAAKYTPDPPTPTRLRWKIESPILQGQGFFLKWSKNLDQTGAEETAKHPTQSQSGES
jgi:hypothetical protein